MIVQPINQKAYKREDPFISSSFDEEIIQERISKIKVINNQIKKYKNTLETLIANHNIYKLYYDNLLNIERLFTLICAKETPAKREEIFREMMKKFQHKEIFISRSSFKTYITNEGSNLYKSKTTIENSSIIQLKEHLMSNITYLYMNWHDCIHLRNDIRDLIEIFNFTKQNTDQLLLNYPRVVYYDEFNIILGSENTMYSGFADIEILNIMELFDKNNESSKITIIQDDMQEKWLWRGHRGYLTSMSNLTEIFKFNLMSKIEPYSFKNTLLSIDEKTYESCLEELENFNSITVTEPGHFILLSFISKFHEISTPIKLAYKCNYCDKVMHYMGTTNTCKGCFEKYVTYKKPFLVWLNEGLFDVFILIINQSNIYDINEMKFKKLLELKKPKVQSKQNNANAEDIINEVFNFT